MRIGVKNISLVIADNMPFACLCIDYLRYARCFQNVSLSEQKCSPVIKRVQTMSFDPSIKGNIEDELKKFCWFVDNRLALSLTFR